MAINFQANPLSAETSQKRTIESHPLAGLPPLPEAQNNMHSSFSGIRVNLFKNCIRLTSCCSLRALVSLFWSAFELSRFLKRVFSGLEICVYATLFRYWNCIHLFDYLYFGLWSLELVNFGKATSWLSLGRLWSHPGCPIVGPLTSLLGVELLRQYSCFQLMCYQSYFYWTFRE